MSNWDGQKIQMLKDMWGHGFSASDIARRLGGGITRNAVIGKAYRMDLSAGIPQSRSASGASPKKVSEGARVKPEKKVMLRAAPAMARPPTQISKMPVVKRAADVMKSTAVPPLKTTERQCRWPYGDPRSKDFKFCGCGAVEGLPYCMDHARVAYQNFGRSRRREESPQQAAAAPAPVQQGAVGGL